MSDSIPPLPGADSRTRLWSGAIILAVAVQALIYLYLYVYIFQRSNPMGDGMEWVAVMPATFVLAAGAGPALALRSSRRPLPLAFCSRGSASCSTLRSFSRSCASSPNPGGENAAPGGVT